MSLLEVSSNALGGAFYNLWDGVIGSAVSILVAVIIFVLGWVIASVVEKLIEQLFKAIMVDKALKSAGVEEALSRGGINLNSGAFFGGLVKWFLIVVVLMASLQVVGLTQVNDFLRSVVVYLPNVIVAALVLLVAAVVSSVVDKIVTSSARSAGVSSAGFLGGVSRWAIWIFAIMAALVQLGIAGQLMFILLQGVVAMLAIAGGLAFGLGGKDAAARYIEKLREEISNKKN
jgi:hypothetical protein